MKHMHRPGCLGDNEVSDLLGRQVLIGGGHYAIGDKQGVNKLLV